MPIIPRWRFMTSEAKTLVRTMGISVILLLVVLDGVPHSRRPAVAHGAGGFFALAAAQALSGWFKIQASRSMPA